MQDLTLQRLIAEGLYREGNPGAMCRLAGWKLASWRTGEIRALDCKAWSCPVHGRLHWWRWWVRLRSHHWNVFGTITRIPTNIPDQQLLWRECRRLLFPPHGSEFVRVLERGGRGQKLLHWHFLASASLPSGLLGGVLADRPWDLGCWRAASDELSRLSVSLGGGFTKLERVRTSPKAAGYVLKYILKDGMDLPKGMRRIVCSRSVASWPATVERYKGEVIGQADQGEWKLLSPWGLTSIDRYDMLTSVRVAHRSVRQEERVMSALALSTALGGMP